MALNDVEEAALRKEFADYKANSVSKAVLQTRIDAKNAHIATLETGATEAAAKHTELEGQFKAFKSKAETHAMLGDNGVTSADARGILLHRYNQLSEADRPDLSTWVGKDGAARSDSLVAHVFGKSVDPVDSAGRQKKVTVPTPNGSEGKQAVKFTTEVVGNLSLEDRIKNHDQIIKDLGF